MIEITAEIRAFIDKAAAGVELAGDEYIDPSDGLIHCKKCGGQRQTVVPCFGKSGYFMPRCICQCQQEAEEQRKRRWEPYINQLPDYAYLCKDLLNGKM